MPDLTTLLSKFLNDLYAGTLGSSVPITSIGVSSGTAAAPSYNFSSQSGLGFYRPSANVIGVMIPSYSTSVPAEAFSSTSGFNIGNALGLNFMASGGAIGAFSVTVASPSSNVLVIGNAAGTTGGRLDYSTDGTLKLRGAAGTAGTGNLDVGATVTGYNNTTTVGTGLGYLVATGRFTAQTAAKASICTYTVGAADETIIGWGNVNVTASTTHSFGLNFAYTDETNTGRSGGIIFTVGSGSIPSSPGVVNTTGVSDYRGVPSVMRCKAGTTVVPATVGTFTSVTYNVEAYIMRIG